MKKIESGRSMIEMLGVLAIVGVLSIGGLAGYQMAMNRYRASSISDYASRCVVVAQTKKISGRIYKGTALATSTAPADCNANVLNEAIPSFLGTDGSVEAYDDDDGIAVVKVTGIPKAVQDVLQERFEGKAIGGVKYATTTAGSSNATGVSTFTFGAS